MVMASSTVKDRAISDELLIASLAKNNDYRKMFGALAGERIKELLAENARLKSELTELRSK